jgi:hypothetical protein
VIFPSKKDAIAYLAIPAGLAMVAAGVGVPVLVLVAPPPRPPGPVFAVLVVVFPLLVGLGILLLWAFFAASLEITGDDLRIRFGLLRWNIPLQALVEVVPKKSMFSHDWGLNFAFSLDRVSIKYRKKSWRMAFPLIVSPRDKYAFLLALAEARPDLEVAEDGSLRQPTVKR